jgi:hypothetical protein
MYFLKWNFTDMEGYSKRYLSYFVIGLAVTLGLQSSDWFFITPVLIFADLTQDIIRSRYQEFKKEQTDIIETLKK